MTISRRSASRFAVPAGRGRGRTGSPYSRRRLAIEPLEDRQLLAVGVNTPPTIAMPLPDMTVDQGTVQDQIPLADVFREPDAGDSLVYSVTAPVTIADIVARVREGAATTAEDESVQIDSLREILGTDSTPADSTSTIYAGLMYAHFGQDRSLDSGEHDTARQSIFDYFRSLGLDTHLEQFTYLGMPYYNVVAEKRGATRPNDVYVVGAHYDSYEIMGPNSLLGSPGADEDASGVAAMMDLAYALGPYHFDSTIRFVAFDREEQGLFGSMGYVGTHATDQLKGMISLDTIGYNPTHSATGVVNLWDADGKGTIKSDLLTAFNVNDYSGPVTADDRGQKGGSAHVPFENAGYDAVMITENGTNPDLHTINDSLERRNIDFAYLTNITKGVAGYLCTAAGLLGRSDLFRATISESTLTLTYLSGQVGTGDCTIRATDNSGAWVEDTFAVTLKPANHAPVMIPFAPTLPAITEDQLNGAGVTVASFVGGSVSDSDAGASQGIAITATNSGQGTWQYWITDPATTDWIAFPDDLSSIRALLLRAEDKVRLSPDGLNADTASFTYQAWDQTNPTRNRQGQQWGIGTAELSGASGMTANSIIEASAGLGDPTLGMAIINAPSGGGTWQYWNSHRSMWNTVPLTVSATEPLKLGPDITVRFVPDGVSVVSASLTYQAWNPSTDAVLGSWVMNMPGGSSPFSSASDTATLVVAAANDAPVLDDTGDPSLGAIAEDTPGNGTLVSSLISSVPVDMIQDVDTDSLQGIAVTLADNAHGTWQYTLDGNVWSNIGVVSETSARLLASDASTRIRFVPAPDFNLKISEAVTPTISFRAWDRSTGPNGGIANTTRTGVASPPTDSSPFSAKPETASITVWEVNDSPVRIQGTVLGLTVGPHSGTTPLGLSGIIYSPGGGADEAGLDVNGDSAGSPQQLTYHVTAVPPADLGDIVLADGTTKVTASTTAEWTLAQLRGMQFRPAGIGTGTAPFTFTVTDNGTTNGEANAQTLIESLSIRVLPETTPGLFDPDSSWFYLRTENSSGNADHQFGYGEAGGGWTTLVGDWNGDAFGGVGLYNPDTSVFYLTNAYTTGYAEVTFGYGEPKAGWIPLVGDWNGDGKAGVGLYDPNSSTFYLTNTLTSGYAEYTFGYGEPKAGWTPLVGDWNGDGKAGVGLYNPHTSTFYLTNTLTTGVAQHTFGYGEPDAKWQPLVGDWDGDRADGVGLFDPKGSVFYLTNQLSSGNAESMYGYGLPNNGWKPLVGDWNSDGKAGVGLYDGPNSTFHLSDKLAWGQCEYDVAFGHAGVDYVPLVGSWTPKPSPKPAPVQAVAADEVYAQTDADLATSQTLWPDGDPLSALSTRSSDDTSSVDAFFADLG